MLGIVLIVGSQNQDITFLFCAYDIGEYGQACHVIQQQQNGYFMKNY